MWAKLILLLAALVLVPMGIRLLPEDRRDPRWLWQAAKFSQLPAALLLAGAYCLPQGQVAAALAVPWLATTAGLAIVGVIRGRRHIGGPLAALCLNLALVYLVVGSGWAVLDRLGVRPLDFEPVIVLLTAIHFHYAGFVLPLITGLILRRVRQRTAGVAGVGVLVGVPLVAGGITATQLGADELLECIAAWTLAISGLIVAWFQVRLAFRTRWPWLVRCLWTVAGISLGGSMVLAALYGSRHFFPMTALDIPWMRALHGSANSLGFGLVGLLGWTLAGEQGAGESAP